MHYLHLVIALVFTLFAIVQWNDPDPWIWIGIYLIVGGVAFLAYRRKYYFYFNLVITLGLLITLGFYVPDMMSWMRNGMPSIVESMHASSLYIELVREFFGLLIALLTMSYYLVLSKKNQI